MTRSNENSSPQEAVNGIIRTENRRVEADLPAGFLTFLIRSSVVLNRPSRRGTPLRPLLAEAVAVAQKPIEADQGVPALDRTTINQSLDFSQCLDHDANVLVLLGQAVHPRGSGRIDAATK